MNKEKDPFGIWVGRVITLGLGIAVVYLIIFGIALFNKWVRGTI